MARSSSNSKSNSKFKSIPPPPRPPSKPKINSSPPPPKQTPTTSSSSDSFMSNLVSGFAFGTGSSIANRTIGTLFNFEHVDNSNSNLNKNVITHPSCETLYKEYTECVKETNLINNCDFALGMLKECENNNKS